MRVAYVVSTIAKTGPTRQLLNLLRSTGSDVIDNKVLTLSPEPADSLWMSAATLAHCSTLGLSRLHSLLYARSLIAAWLNEFAPDVVHTQGIRADRLVSSLPGPWSHVATIRNDVYVDYPLKFGRIRGTVMAHAHMRALQKVQSPVTCSEELAGTYRRRGIEVIAIRNGVDTDHFSPARKDQTPHRVPRHSGAREVVFVWVGAFIPRKEAGILLEAFRHAFPESGPVRANLVLVGDGPQRADLESRYASERIRFVGAVADPVPYLGEADWSVSASSSEGLPNAVMESLACGTPALLSAIPAHAELADVAGEACELVEPGIESWAGALRRVSSYPEDSLWGLQAKARRAAVDQLSAQRMASEYRSLYRRLVDEKAGKSI